MKPTKEQTQQSQTCRHVIREEIEMQMDYIDRRNMKRWKIAGGITLFLSTFAILFWSLDSITKVDPDGNAIIPVFLSWIALLICGSLIRD